MTTSDRWWVVWCAFGAVGVAKAGTGWYELIAYIVWGVILVLVAAHQLGKEHRTGKVTVPVVPTPGGEPSAVDAVRIQLEAYLLAGFSEVEAKTLMQEALRVAVKQQGGWRP